MRVAVLCYNDLDNVCLGLRTQVIDKWYHYLKAPGRWPPWRHIYE